MNKQRLLEVASDLEAGNLPPDTAFDMQFTYMTQPEVSWFSEEQQKAMKRALHGCGSCCCIAGLICLKYSGMDRSQSHSSDGSMYLAAQLVGAEYGGGIDGLFFPAAIPTDDWPKITTRHAATAVRAFVATGDGARCWDGVLAELREGQNG